MDEDYHPRIYFIVGLGNPGVRYNYTPHNLGFLVIDQLAKRHDIRVRSNEHLALTGAGTIGGRNVVLVKPQTFMNRSGLSVKALMESRKLTHKDLILVYDDLDLPWTGLRIKKKGSSAGHNGVKSVIASVGTDWFARVRLGVDPGHEVNNATDYLLAPFERVMRSDLDEVVSYATDAVEFIIAEGAIRAMTRFNRRARGLKEEEE